MATWGGGFWLRPLRLTPIKPALASTEASFPSTARCGSRPPTAPGVRGYCARPPFALDRLREFDREHLIYDHPKPGPGGSGPQLLAPLELLDRRAEPATASPRKKSRFTRFKDVTPEGGVIELVVWRAMSPRGPARCPSSNCSPTSTASSRPPGASGPRPVMPARRTRCASTSVWFAARYWRRRAIEVRHPGSLPCPACVIAGLRHDRYQVIWATRRISMR